MTFDQGALRCKLTICCVDRWVVDILCDMTRILCSQDQGRWCGYLQDHPDRQAHRESFEELEIKLRQLSSDLIANTLANRPKIA